MAKSVNLLAVMLLVLFTIPYVAISATEGETTSENVVRADAFGFDPNDATHALQQAIDSGATLVVVPRMSTPWIVSKPINLRSNMKLFFERGAEVHAAKDAFKGRNDCLFIARNVENVLIRGYGATWRMRRDDYANPEKYAKAEWRHTLSLRGCRNITVEGLTLLNSGGDGVYIGVSPADEIFFCENITLRDLVVEDHYRQGLSVISVHGLLVERCCFNRTRGTAPMAGIDLEPNRPNERLADVVVRDCVISDNEKLGLHMWLSRLKSQSYPVSVLFENCDVSGPRTDVGLHVGTIGDDGPKGSIIFSRCRVSNTRVNGIRLRDKSANSVDVIFDRCVVRDTGAHPVKMWKVPVSGPVAIYTIYKKTTRPGGIQFKDCLIIDDHDRPFMTILDGINYAPEGALNIGGTIGMISPYQPKVAAYLPLTNFDLRLRSGDMVDVVGQPEVRPTQNSEQ